jgi:3-oxoacyl-[acyl-carrier-protein] synthase-1
VAPPPPLPIFIGLPEDRAGAPLAAGAFVAALAAQTGVALDESASRAFPAGRAAALLALDAGLRFLREGRGERALVGGADSYLDLGRLSELDREQRLLGPRASDGFIPGEGAAFLLLSRAPARAGGAPNAPQRRAVVLGAGTGRDAGHRYSDQPARGEGLALAIDILRASLPSRPAPVEHTYAGFNGESFHAKEWGVARLRHYDLFTPASGIDHPADCYGDAGAATGALLLAIAGAALSRGDRRGPALVFAASDREDRACALLDVLA